MATRVRWLVGRLAQVNLRAVVEQGGRLQELRAPVLASGTTSFTRRFSEAAAAAAEAAPEEPAEENEPVMVFGPTGLCDRSDKEPHGVTDEKIVKLADELVHLKLWEIRQLTTILQERESPVMFFASQMSIPEAYGGAAGPRGGGGGAGGGEAAAAEAPKAAEKTDFDLKLESFDAGSKIKVIKEVRALTELGLKEAKALVESTPAVLKKGLSKEVAEAAVAKLKEVGAVVVLE